MPFQSAEAYRHFAESVKHDRRFIYQENVTGFLSAVEETAVSRIHTLKNGQILWRAQMGSQTRIQDKGEPEEMEVEAPWLEGSHEAESL